MGIKINWKKVVIIIGLVGSVASIVSLQSNFFINKSNTQLTVFVTDDKGNAVLENQGQLNIPIGNRLLNAKIGENGRTNFGDITSSNIGDTIIIGLKAKGWGIIGEKNTYIYNGGPIQLKVQRDKSLRMITGSVKSRDGQSFISEALIRINNDTTTYTNELGVFRILLSEKHSVLQETDRYKLTISKEGYKTIEQYHTPNTSDAEIRLNELDE